MKNTFMFMRNNIMPAIKSNRLINLNKFNLISLSQNKNIESSNSKSINIKKNYGLNQVSCKSFSEILEAEKDVVLKKSYFHNGKYTIIEQKLFSQGNYLFKSIATNSLLLVFGYQAVNKFMRFQFIRGTFYSICFVCSFVFKRLNGNWDSNSISGMQLFEDGKRVEVCYSDNKKHVYDISSIRILDEIEKKTLLKTFKIEDLANRYPIIINDELNFIHMDTSIYDRKIFDLIKCGEYITVINDDEDFPGKNKDKVIDV